MDHDRATRIPVTPHTASTTTDDPDHPAAMSLPPGKRSAQVPERACGEVALPVWEW